MKNDNYPMGVTDADFDKPEPRWTCWQCAYAGRVGDKLMCFADAILDDEPTCVPVGWNDEACDLFEG